MGDEDKRKFKRFEFSVDAAYKRHDDQSKSGKGMTGDFSREGLKFFTGEQLDKGTLLDLDFEIPGQERPVKATGEVMWCIAAESAPAPYAVGVKLVNIDPDDKFRVLDYAYHHWLRNEFGDVNPE